MRSGGKKIVFTVNHGYRVGYMDSYSYNRIRFHIESLIFTTRDLSSISYLKKTKIVI